MTAPLDRPLRVALTVLGCKVNFAEMADLAGRLAAGGCEVVPETDAADVRVLNSCTVTAQADATTRAAHPPPAPARPRRAPRAHRVQRRRESRRVHHRRLDLRQSPTRTASPTTSLAMSAAIDAATRGAVDALPRVRQGAGRLQSSLHVLHRVAGARRLDRAFPHPTVHDRVRAAIDAGHGEIVLCGVDLGSYGRDIGTNLATLVGSLLDVCGESARIRLSSINANDVTDALIALNAHPTALLALAHAAPERQRSACCAQCIADIDAHSTCASRARCATVNPATEFTTDIMVAIPRRDRGRPRRDAVAGR